MHLTGGKLEGDNTGATEDCPYLSGGVYGDAWIKFTIPSGEVMDVSVAYCGTSPPFLNGYIVMDQSCPCSGSFIYAANWNNTECGDGNYTLTIRRSLLRDASGYALSGDDYTHSFHRFYGDWDGDRDVDWTDVMGLVRAYGRRNWASSVDAAFDHDGDGDSDFFDILPMFHRYGRTLPL